MLGPHGAGPANARVRQELLDVVARCGVHAGVVMVVSAALVGTLMWRTAPSPAVAAWVAATVLIAAVRIVVCMRWGRARQAGSPEVATGTPLDGARLQRSERTHAALAFVSGVTWASLGFLAGEEPDRTTLLVGFGLTIGLVLASSFHSAHRAGYFLSSVRSSRRRSSCLSASLSTGRDVLLLAWFGLVAVLYLLPRFPWTSLRQGLVMPCDRSSRIRTAGWRSNAASSASATR